MCGIFIFTGESKILVRLKKDIGRGQGRFGANKHLNYLCQNSCLHRCDLNKHKDGALYQSLDLQRLRGMILSQEQAFFITFRKYKKAAHYLGCPKYNQYFMYTL